MHTEFFQMLQYLLATSSIDIIVGNFKYDRLKVSENELLEIFTHHAPMVNKPKHIPGSLIGHIYIKKSLMEEFFTNVSVETFALR